MTIPLNHLARPLADRDMVQPYSVVDSHDEPHAELTVRVVVTRDQLASAVEEAGTSFYGGDRHPDLWTVEEVRAFAAMHLVTSGSMELQQGAENIASMVADDCWDPEARDYCRAVYRAVDRAFPKTA